MPRTTQSSCSESSCQSLKNGCSFDGKFLGDLGHLEVSSSRSLVCTGQEVHAALNSVSVTTVSADVSATSVSSSKPGSELGSGSRDKQSAVTFSRPGFYWIS